MKQDTRNVILAMLLSALVIFGYQFLYLGPQQQRAQEQRPSRQPPIAWRSRRTSSRARST